jgi:Protein of unknown function (DUF3574)
MRKLASAAAITAVALAIITEAAAQPLECRGAQKPAQVAEVIFGRNIGSRTRVSERDWSRFVDREIAPRFPDGLTVLNGNGQWREPGSGKIIREPNKIVQIALPGQAEDFSRLDEIAEAYKRRFKQHSVGVIVRPACVSF